MSIGGGTATFRPVAPYWWLTNFGGIVANGIIAARSKKRLATLTFALGAGYHVIAAGYAYCAARAARFDDAWKWGLQTLAVGTPSVRTLNAVLRDRAVDGEGSSGVARRLGSSANWPTRAGPTLPS